MIATVWVDVLTYGHVLSAIAWLGAVLTVNLILGPVMNRFSPGTRYDLLRLFLPRFALVTESAAGLTVVFGAGLYAVLYSDATSQWKMTIGAGILVALIAFVLGLVVSVPLTRRLSRMVPADGTVPTGPPPEGLLQGVKRLQLSSFLGMILLLVALGFMVASAQL